MGKRGLYITHDKLIRLGECIFDITELLGNRIQFCDSRDKFGTIYSWAVEFERRFDDDTGDYLSDLDNFVSFKIRENLNA